MKSAVAYSVDAQQKGMISAIGKHIYYGWLIVAISLLNLMTLYGVWYSYSVFMVTLSGEFGWSRTVASSIFTLFTLVIALTSPLIGFCVDRYGSKKVLACGALILAAGLFLCSKAGSTVSFYIFFGLIAGLGGSAIGLVGNSHAVANWFTEKRGLASGIATSGIGLGMLVIVPMVQNWIQRYGWRDTFWILALLVAVVLIPVNLVFQRNRPVEPEADKDRDAGHVSSCSRHELISICMGFPAIFKTHTFRRMFFVFFTGGLVVQAVLIHQVAIANDGGFRRQAIGIMIVLLGLCGIAGRMIWGMLSDLIGRKKAYLFASFTLSVGICLILAAKELHSQFALFGYAVLFGTGYAAIAPLNWSVAADIYSGSRFGSIYGLLFMGTGLGAAVGPLLSGFVFDLSSSYVAAFILAVLCLFFSNRMISKLYPKVLSCKEVK